MNYLKNKWSSVPDVSQRINLFFSDSFSRPAGNIVQLCSSMSVSDSLSKYCPFCVNISQNGVREVRLFYSLIAPKPATSSTNTVLSSAAYAITPNSYLHSTSLTPIASLPPGFLGQLGGPLPNRYINNPSAGTNVSTSSSAARSSNINTIGDDTMMVFLSSMCDAEESAASPSTPVPVVNTDTAVSSPLPQVVPHSDAAVLPPDEGTLSSIWNLFKEAREVNNTSHTCSVAAATPAIVSCATPSPCTTSSNGLEKETSNDSPIKPHEVKSETVAAQVCDNSEQKEEQSTKRRKTHEGQDGCGTTTPIIEYNSHSNSTLDTVSSSSSAASAISIKPLTILQLTRMTNSKPHLKRITPTFVRPLYNGKRSRSIGE